MRQKWMVLVLIFVIGCGALAQTRYYAKCQQVINGHTVVVFHHNKFSTIRLREAVCYEEPHTFWSEARAFTAKLLEKRMCEVIVFGEGESAEDDESRVDIGEIILPDKRRLSLALIKAGWAWWNEPEGLIDKYAISQEKARKEKLGIWSSRSVRPPWVLKPRIAKEEEKAEE